MLPEVNPAVTRRHIGPIRRVDLQGRGPTSHALGMAGLAVAMLSEKHTRAELDKMGKLCDELSADGRKTQGLLRIAEIEKEAALQQAASANKISSALQAADEARANKEKDGEVPTVERIEYLQVPCKGCCHIRVWLPY